MPAYTNVTPKNARRTRIGQGCRAQLSATPAVMSFEYRRTRLELGVEMFGRPFGSHSIPVRLREHVLVQLLLVEDERRFAQLLARRLEDAGYETALAFTGPDGLQRA